MTVIVIDCCMFIDNVMFNVFTDFCLWTTKYRLWDPFVLSIIIYSYRTQIFLTIIKFVYLSSCTLKGSKLIIEPWFETNFIFEWWFYIFHLSTFRHKKIKSSLFTSKIRKFKRWKKECKKNVKIQNEREGEQEMVKSWKKYAEK